MVCCLLCCARWSYRLGCAVRGATAINSDTNCTFPTAHSLAALRSDPIGPNGRQWRRESGRLVVAGGNRRVSQRRSNGRDTRGRVGGTSIELNDGLRSTFSAHHVNWHKSPRAHSGDHCLRIATDFELAARKRPNHFRCPGGLPREGAGSGAGRGKQ